MCANQMLMTNPKFREALAKSLGINTEEKKDPVKEQQKQTAQSIQKFGLMGAALASPQIRQQMNSGLRINESGLTPTVARRMNRKG